MLLLCVADFPIPAITSKQNVKLKRKKHVNL